jgi:transposase
MGKNNTKNYAIDGHVIKNKSALNLLANYGNKFEKINSKQIVSMTMIGLESMLPVHTSVFNGAQLDKQAINEFIDLENFQDYLFVIDCGFYSEENIKCLETKNRYIIPLSSNLKTYKDAIINQNLNGQFSFTISKNKKKENILIKYQKISLDNKNIYIFKDVIKAAGEEAD